MYILSSPLRSIFRASVPELFYVAAFPMLPIMVVAFLSIASVGTVKSVHSTQGLWVDESNWVSKVPMFLVGTQVQSQRLVERLLILYLTRSNSVVLRWMLIISTHFSLSLPDKCLYVTMEVTFVMLHQFVLLLGCLCTFYLIVPILNRAKQHCFIHFFSNLAIVFR
jgi:hypothetical protein